MFFSINFSIKDGSGSIDVKELEEPLISLGLAENKKEVKKIV